MTPRLRLALSTESLPGIPFYTSFLSSPSLSSFISHNVQSGDVLSQSCNEGWLPDSFFVHPEADPAFANPGRSRAAWADPAVHTEALDALET